MAVINEGTWDRVIRVVAAIVLAYFGWITWPGAASVVLFVIGAIALFTGVVGWCALYSLIGVSTKRKVSG